MSGFYHTFQLDEDRKVGVIELVGANNIAYNVLDNDGAVIDRNSARSVAHERPVPLSTQDIEEIITEDLAPQEDQAE